MADKKQSTLYHGDCLIELGRVEDGSVDLIYCDLPFNVTACKWDKLIPFEPLWTHFKRVLKPRGAVVAHGVEPFSSHLRLSNLEWYKYDWVWEKSKASNFLQAGYMPLKAHENICVFCGNYKPTYNPQMTQGKPYSGRAGKKGSNSDVVNNVPNPQFRRGSKNGLRKPRTVLYFKTPESEGETMHPTQKPVSLAEYILKTYTNPGDLVLDPTMGSGTCGVAAASLNRRFIGIELDDHYFQVASERIAKAESAARQVEMEFVDA